MKKMNETAMLNLNGGKVVYHTPDRLNGYFECDECGEKFYFTKFKAYRIVKEIFYGVHRLFDC